MLDEQLESYPGREDFVFALIGAYSICARAEWLLSIEAPSGAEPCAPALVDCALGILSLSRTLRAQLGLVQSAHSPSASALPPHVRWLR